GFHSARKFSQNMLLTPGGEIAQILLLRRGKRSPDLCQIGLKAFGCAFTSDLEVGRIRNRERDEQLRPGEGIFLIPERCHVAGAVKALLYEQPLSGTGAFVLALISRYRSE